MSSAGKIMNEVGSLGVRGHASPDSDCNSNHHGSASYLSNTSSQDIDFIQDNSDYQWFLDYGYRDGGVNHHTSILSLPDAYANNDINYYDAFAKNMDANLAEADMESFKTEDIHALLTNLPPMCTDHLSQESNREGECYASVSGSMMAKFEFDSSISPQSSSHGEDSAMSIYKSELLFSPVKETPMPGANFSVDSLDCDMMLTCQANKDNYTIAFEGSVMYSEDSDYQQESNKTRHWSADLCKQKLISKLVDASMTQSDSGSLTTWSKLKTSATQLRRHPSGNNNNGSTEETSYGLHDSSPKSHSMPNLHRERLRNLLVNRSNDARRRRAVKVFDIQHHTQSSCSDMATSVDASGSEPRHFSLVKLFMKQKSMSTEGMSTTMDQLSSSENWQSEESGHSEARRSEIIAEEPEPEPELDEAPMKQIERSFKGTKHNLNNNNTTTYSTKLRRKQDLMSRSIQTSQFSEVTNLKNTTKLTPKARTSYKIVEPSFLAKLRQEGEEKKPVYVLYPNYVLPNLDFLNERSNDLSKVLLLPQEAPTMRQLHKKRPFSCTDVEHLKKKGFNHVQDWDSLNFLLPNEYRHILADIPELKTTKVFNSRTKRRPLSSDYTPNQTSSSSSTATQPSSGYRGSSTILNDSQNSPAPIANLNPLFVYRYDSVTSSEASFSSDKRKDEKSKPITTSPALPLRYVNSGQDPHTRPPLPRGILRKDAAHKRYSLYETSDEEPLEDTTAKRKSLHDPAHLLHRLKKYSETEDEGVDAGASSSSVDEHHESLRTTSPNLQKQDFLLSHISTDDLLQLGEFLKISGISASDGDDLTEESLMQLRSYVGKFLSLKINQDFGRKNVSFGNLPRHLDQAPHNSPNVSALMNHLKQAKTSPICEEGEAPSSQSLVVLEKQPLISALTDSVDKIVAHFGQATSPTDLATLGDSCLNPTAAHLVLTALCPALYALLSDGLRPQLDTSFGPIPNSVWQVVEASAQQGPLTKSLNELVMRINGETGIGEGLLKCNAFVLGLLNVRSLDAWLGYLRTRETILRRHYAGGALLVRAQTGGAPVRALLDAAVAALRPLALLPFQLELLFECRQLRESFRRMEAMSTRSESEESSAATVYQCAEVARRERPRSCVEVAAGGTSESRKRWSGISVNSKLYLVYDRLAREEAEEYVDSLEGEGGPESLGSNADGERPIDGRRFRKLQQKWEMLSGRESQSPPLSPTGVGRSRIPRPITSPVRPSGIPVLISPTAKAGGKLVKKAGPAVKAAGRGAEKKVVLRTSRVDQVESNESPRHNPRPSSLPYKNAGGQKVGKTTTPPRRAASSSLNRKTINPKAAVPKMVRTLSHRLPSESGHLSFNEGERLKVVLEVDTKWLLCCRGAQKGLVPKSAVIAADLGGRFGGGY